MQTDLSSHRLPNFKVPSSVVYSQVYLNDLFINYIQERDDYQEKRDVSALEAVNNKGEYQEEESEQSHKEHPDIREYSPGQDNIREDNEVQAFQDRFFNRRV